MATRIADWLAENVISAHKPIFDRMVRVAREYEAELVAKINSLERESRKMKELVERMTHSSNSDTTTAVVLYASIGDRERNLADLKRQLHQSRLSSLGHKNTAVVATDTLLRQSVKARVGLSAAVGGVLGMMVSIFLAFFVEYVERAKSRDSVVRSEESRGRTQE
jgi:ElaB/YqjD/DUF883 family membrane-anchored ribosome-binding protein